MRWDVVHSSKHFCQGPRGLHPNGSTLRPQSKTRHVTPGPGFSPRAGRVSCSPVLAVRLVQPRAPPWDTSMPRVCGQLYHWLLRTFLFVSSPTAIMQTMARKNGWPLDKMCLTVDVTKKTKEDYGHPPREGACLHGLVMEGRVHREEHYTVRT